MSDLTCFETLQTATTVRSHDAQVMLWTIAVILFILWLVGWLGFHLLGGFIHILVVLAVIFVIIAIIKRV